MSLPLSVTVAEILKSAGFITYGLQITDSGEFVNSHPKFKTDIAIITGVRLANIDPYKKRTRIGRHVSLTPNPFDPASIPAWTKGMQTFIVRDVHSFDKWSITFDYAIIDNAIRICEKHGFRVPDLAIDRQKILCNQIEAVIAHRKKLACDTATSKLRPYVSF